MKLYAILLKVLDQLCSEAPILFKTYHPSSDDLNAVTVARCRAYIHLLLKVRFGLLDFQERESFVTEGTGDGGVDAYYVEESSKTVWFIQSKFRQTEKNFEEKHIEPEELLRMDVDRMLKGEHTDINGSYYSDKILKMVREIQSIEGIARYSYRVIILANAKGITLSKLNILTGGFPAELIDYHKSYNDLLFPLLSGTYFTSDELHLSLTLSNKNAGAKISYSVQTEHAKAEITVVFVPTVEIAKIMYKYRNAILKYNPRNYLENEGQYVNGEIRRTIEDRSTNEFALFNNGITILSDETYLNERIGQKDRAQLTLINPQILNGGQTAYTLSQIYKDNLNGRFEAIFENKEVLVKIITLDQSTKVPELNKLRLIEDISRATNSQTVVSKADRRSNEMAVQALQKRCFERLGVFLERKRGEFADGVREGYLQADAITERNMFLRAALVAMGDLKSATKKRLAVTSDYERILNVEDAVFDNFRITLISLQLVHKGTDKQLIKMRYSGALKSFVSLILAKQRFGNGTLEVSEIQSAAEEVDARWDKFISFCQKKESNLSFILSHKERKWLDTVNFLQSPQAKSDIREFFGEAIPEA
jgi:hypothetical protein